MRKSRTRHILQALLMGLLPVLFSACDLGESKFLKRTGDSETSNAKKYFTVASVYVTEGNTAVFTLTFNTALTASTTIGYTTSNLTATAGSDYTAATGSITLAAGEKTQTFSISTTDDMAAEAQESFRITFTHGANYDTGTSAQQAVGFITDNDTAGALYVSDVTAAEGTQLAFTVNLTSVVASTVTVNYSLSDGTATTADSDYTTASGTLTFIPGDTQETITVNSTADTHYEVDETLTLTLSGGTNYSASGSDLSATGTITNNDSVPTISISDVSANEGSSLGFAATLSNRTYQTVTINYASSNGTATTADNDYTSASGSLTFNPGETSKSLPVTTAADTKYENSETVTMTLSGGANYTVAGSTFSATGTVTNDDAVPTISIASNSAAEGSSLVFTITQDRTSAFATTFSYASSNGTGSAGSDYTSTSGTGTIAAGNTTTTITVPLTEDSSDETDETFTMTMSGPSNATITTAAATGTIIDTAIHYDFLSGSLPANTTFARGSTATYTDADGNVATAAINTPRFDRDPNDCPGSVCAHKGLLMEPEATNLIVRSDAFDNASWTKTGLLAVNSNAGDSASPDGVNTNAEVIREALAISAHSISQTIGTIVTAGALVHFTVYVKAYSSPVNYFRLKVYSGANLVQGNYDLTLGNSPTAEAGGDGGGQAAATIQDVGNGWYRARLSGVASTSATALSVSISLQNSFGGAESYLGDNTSGINVWGAQLEVGGTVPTSYVPTTNATVTRAADSLQSSLFTGFSSPYGDGTNWTMITDFSRPIYEPSTTTATPRVAELCAIATCATNRISSIYTATAGTFGTTSVVGGATQGSSTTGAITPGANTAYQLGVVKTSGVIQTFMNGTAYAATGTLTYPTVDVIYLGGSNYTGSSLYGHLRKFTFRARSVPNANMLTLTSD